MKSVQKIVTREERSVTQEFYSDSNQQGGANNGIPSIQSNQSQLQNSLLNNTFENMSLSNQQNQNQIQQQQNVQGQNLSQQKCTKTSKTSKTSINQTFSSSNSNSFDDATSFDGGFNPTPSPLSIRQDSNTSNTNNSNSRKVVNTSNISKKSETVQRTNQQMSTDSFDDDNNSSTNTSNFASPSPSPSVSRQDITLSNNSATTNTNRSQKVVNTSNVSKTTKINQQKIASDSSIDEAYNVTSPTISPPSTRRDVQNNQNQRITDTSNTNVVTTIEDTLKSSPMKTCKVEEIWKVEETKYTMIISVGKEYGPEDVKITVKERIMSVVVKKEKFSQIDGSSLGFQGFGKSFTVPSDADFSGIKSTFTTEGNLRIEVSRITQTSKTTSTSTTTTTEQQKHQQQQQQLQQQQQQQQQQNTNTNITKKAVNTSNTSNTTRNTTNNESNNQIQQNSNVRNNTNTNTNTNNTNTNNSRQTTDNSTSNTSKNTATTLEEGLKTKPMKTCTLEEIWKVEETRYTMTISVGPDYGPEDVKITMKDSIMSVVVKKEKFSQFDGSSLGFAGFGKSFSVPHDADFQGIKSTFTADGNLRIEVPRIQ